MAELLAIEEHLRALEESIARLGSSLAPLETRVLSGREFGADGRLEAGGIVIEHHARKVYVGGVDVPLSPAEYRCLYELVRGAGRVIVHRDLLRRVTGDGSGEMGNLKVYVARLRAKLRTADAPDGLVESVWGIGYRLGLPRVSNRPPPRAMAG